MISDIADSIIEALYQTSLIEYLAVLTSIAYAILASKNNIWCWLFGVLSPALSMYALYFYFQLYAEVYLQVYYIAMAIYGYYTWKYGSSKHGSLAISTWKINKHIVTLFVGGVLSLLLGFILQRYTDAASSYLDSFTTVFAIIATFMTARRVLENWIYWIIIDSVSIYLYANRGGYLFALLFLAYTLIAIYGFINWRKTYQIKHA
jgi:nicotinamide mononucleotide transporter